MNLADITVPDGGVTGLFTIQNLFYLIAIGIVAAAVIAVWRAIPKWVLVLLTAIILVTVAGVKGSGH